MTTLHLLTIIAASFALGYLACRWRVRVTIKNFQRYAEDRPNGLGWWHAAQQISERLNLK